MNLHKVIDITEADFGCEEHSDGAHAVLKIEDGTSIEVSEKWIAENGIDKGKCIHIKEDGSVIKAIEVVAAVIRHGNKIFATQRGYGDFKDRWEFPGGKMEPGEDPKSALVREIKEELDTEIRVGDLIKTVDTDYPAFHITMHVFWCDIVEGDLKLLEHEAAKWVEIDSKLPYAVDWLPADLEVVLEMLERDTVCTIKWTRADIRNVLQEAGFDSSDDRVNDFIRKFDWRYFQEKSIQNGFEMLNSSVD